MQKSRSVPPNLRDPILGSVRIAFSCPASLLKVNIFGLKLMSRKNQSKRLRSSKAMSSCFFNNKTFWCILYAADYVPPCYVSEEDTSLKQATLLGPVHMAVGDPRKGGTPPRWGYQSLHTTTLYFLIAFTCEVGYLTEAGCPVSRGG